MRKALVIGIDNYRQASLTGCVNDATQITNTIEKNGDGSPNFDVKLITDQNTKNLARGFLKEEIESLFKGPSDVALLFFSGHGAITSTGGYIVTPDFMPNDEGISMDEILTLANNSEARDKIIMLDCCHAGYLGSPSVSGSKLAQIGEGITVLSACRTEENALEIGHSGMFTALLIDALQGGATDLRGYITPGSIYSYIDQALGSWDQRPIFKTNVHKFTHVRMVQPPVSLEILRKLPDYFNSPYEEYPLDPSYEETEEDVADEDNVKIFKILQKLESVNIVVPVGEEHMYWAAINSKPCRLTATGYHYWRLAKEGRI